MIGIRQIQIFLAVWEKGSFSKAATMANLAQPTVSSRIIGLERSLGVKLFERHGKSVTPTKAGELFYPYALQIQRLVDEVQREVGLFSRGEKGKLEIGGSNIPGQYILPSRVGKFKTLHPNIQITLKVGDTSSIVREIIQGGVHLGIVGAVLNRKELEYLPCFQDELVLIVPPRHTLSQKTEIEPAELKDVHFITREEGSGTRLATEKAFEAKGLNGFFAELKIVAQMGSTEAIRQAVKAGIGCAIISNLAVEEDLRSGTLYSPKIRGIDLTRRFYLVRHKNRSISPVAESFSRFLLAE